MSRSIVEFAPAKVNLALHVLGRRADGYHDLDSCVAFAGVGDSLRMHIADVTHLTVDGPFALQVPTQAENLVLRAHSALAAKTPLPNIAFHLTKNLPVASGIGGGSADAAAALRGIQSLMDFRFDSEMIAEIALSLGADVPVCLHGKACRMQGVGDMISAVERLPAPAILLVNPLQACSTVDVFRAMALKPGDRFRQALDPARHEQWRNDMTQAACQVLPVISNVLQALADACPDATIRMSGSGATCFALFDTEPQAQAIARRMKARHPDWWIAPTMLF